MTEEENDPSPSRVPIRQWHRLFGILLSDYLAGTPFVVELESDLSQKRQLLDVLIVRRGPGVMDRPLPDGLTDLTDHNLITFKSFREALSDWALKELTGHYVNYRKSLERQGKLPSEDRFRLYALCARTPRNLFERIPPRTRSKGVYEIDRGTDRFRVVAMNELPDAERNSLLGLFSAVDAKVSYAKDHFRLRAADVSTTVSTILGTYRSEGIDMAYTWEDYKRDYGIPDLRAMLLDDFLNGLTPEQRLAGLAPEQRLAGLTVSQIEAILNRMKTTRDVPKAKAVKKKANVSARKKK